MRFKLSLWTTGLIGEREGEATARVELNERDHDLRRGGDGGGDAEDGERRNRGLWNSLMRVRA